MGAFDDMTIRLGPEGADRHGEDDFAEKGSHRHGEKSIKPTIK